MANKLKRIKILLKGVNLGRLYKQCHKSNIQIYNVDRIDYKNIKFEIDIKDAKKLKSIAKQQQFLLEEEKNFGFSKFKNFITFRFGILIGLFIFVILNFFSGLFIWDVKIYGNNSVSREEILNVLKTNNVSVGKIVDAKSLTDIETLLTNQLESISLCSVIKKGTTIIVNIKEKLQLKDLQTDENKDIVAPQNLTITELNVINGTAQKKVGDSVKKGDVIVAGYILDANSNKIACKANATIKAKTWHSVTEIYQKQVQVDVKTGKVLKGAYMTLFNMKFDIKNPKIEFAEYITETKQQVIKNNFLPFKLFITTYYEVAKQTKSQNFEADKQSVIDRCRSEAYKMVTDNETISNVFDTITEEQDFYTITSYIEVTFQF